MKWPKLVHSTKCKATLKCMHFHLQCLHISWTVSFGVPKSTFCTHPSSLKLPLIPGWQVTGWVNIYGFYTKEWILWFQLSCFCLLDSTKPHLSCEIFEVCHLEYMYGKQRPQLKQSKERCEKCRSLLMWRLNKMHKCLSSALLVSMNNIVRLLLSLYV